MHRFCICGPDALLGGLLGISRFVECEFLSLLLYELCFSACCIVPVHIHVVWCRICNVTRFVHLTLLICYVVIVYLLSDQPGVHCCSLVEFHPDSSRLLLFAADDEYNIRVWKLDSSSCTAVLRGHYSAVTAMAFAPDGCLMYRCVCTLTPVYL